MRIVLAVLLVLTALALPPAAGAQSPAATQTAPAAPAPTPPAAAPAGITPDQARQALEVLNDPAKRTAFAATLNAIIKANPAAATKTGTLPAAATPPAATPTPPGALPIPLTPDSLGAQVLVSASALVTHLGTETVHALDTVQSLPLLWGWAVVMVTNPYARDLLVSVSWRVALALACAVAAQYALRRIVRRPIAALEAYAPAPDPTAPETIDADENAPENAEENDPEHAGANARENEGQDKAEAGDIEPLPRARRRPSALTYLRRVPLALGRFLLDLLPVLGIVVIGHTLAGSDLGGPSVSRLIILAVIDAYAACVALLAAARMLLSPHQHRLRLFYLRDAAAAYLMLWTRRLVLIGVIGYAIGEAWLLLGLSEVAHDTYQKAVGLLLHIGVAIMILQSRRAVRDWLSAPDGATGAAAMMRNRLASVWHWIALFFNAAIWLVWAIELPDGYSAIFHYFIITAALLIGARLVLLVIFGGMDRATRSGATILGTSATADARLRAYLPVINLSLRLLVYALCLLALLQLYGANALVWLLSSIAGQRILSSCGTLVVTIIVALTVWEVVNASVQQHLEKLQREAQVAKSARLRTLLPLLRSSLLVAIFTVAGLMVLSEIGINIAPLLAGAGILGVAIGFGSQKLVQDLITGIFLLLENAMQVGDQVTVSGLSGNVEALSVRTIRLRAGDGSVHIIPFSAVTTVTNVNRGLGNASVNVIVDYREDTDRVCTELKSIVAGMRAEPGFSAQMLSDLQLWGVDKVDGGGVTIAGQVVCTDSGRWAVQREFNRRMKMRFQELGIGVFNPARSIALPPPAQPQIEQRPEIEQRDNNEQPRAAE
jgi:moderate conductance mechanosensitive channel